MNRNDIILELAVSPQNEKPDSIDFNELHRWSLCLQSALPANRIKA